MRRKLLVKGLFSRFSLEEMETLLKGKSREIFFTILCILCAFGCLIGTNFPQFQKLRG